MTAVELELAPVVVPPLMVADDQDDSPRARSGPQRRVLAPPELVHLIVSMLVRVGDVEAPVLRVARIEGD